MKKILMFIVVVFFIPSFILACIIAIARLIYTAIFEFAWEVGDKLYGEGMKYGSELLDKIYKK